jgi:hypothetical protein
MLLVDYLDGRSLYDVFHLATSITYMPYRHPEQYFSPSYGHGKLGERLAQGREDRRSQLHMYKALEYCYLFCHILAGNVSEYTEFVEHELLTQLMEGKLKTYDLVLDNHDGFIIHTEDGKYLHLLHGDGDYWLFEISKVDLPIYRETLGRFDSRSTTRVILPRIGQ